jgi:hypothetical protein
MKKESDTIRAAKINAEGTVKAAKINAKGGVVAAIFGGIIAIFGSIIIYKCTKNTTEPNPVKIDPPQIVSTPDNTLKEDIVNIHTVLPNPQKPIPQSVFEHNVKAKELLDKIIKTPDKDIKTLLDNVFVELNKSLKEDEEYGETYYFLGVASYKRGDHFIAINEDIKKIIDVYSDSIHYFEKAELFNYPLSNVLFDRGKTYTALGNIFSNSDSEKSKEYYQKAIEDFNHALVSVCL